MAKVKMKRTLKRDVQIYVADYEDAKYFYAAYKMGAFDEYLKPEKELSPREFSASLAEYAETSTQLFTATVDGSDPLALIHTVTADNRMEVHVIWMPWASKRNKVEITVKFFKDMGENYTLLTIASEKNKGLSFHVRKYGVMRFVGKIRDYFQNEDDTIGYMFQGVRHG